MTSATIGLGRPPRPPRFRVPDAGLGDLIPPYVGYARLKTARVPSPPPLDPDLSLAEQCWRLAVAYRVASRHVFGKESYCFRNRDALRASKHFAALQKAAPVVVRLQLQPLPWARWSMEFWRESENAKGHPPLTWVWSPGRLEKREGWFSRESGGFDGGLYVLSDEQRRLSRQYHDMVAELSELPAGASDAQVRGVVAANFPGDWRASYAAVLVANAKTQDAINGIVRRGDWVW